MQSFINFSFATLPPFEDVFFENVAKTRDLELYGEEGQLGLYCFECRRMSGDLLKVYEMCRVFYPGERNHEAE